MMSFKTYLTEVKAGAVAGASAGILVMRAQSLRTKIRSEENLARKIDLLSQQNVELSYLCALNVALAVKDQRLIHRFKGTK